MAFSYTLLEIGDDRTIELYMKLIRLNGLESDPAIGIPTVIAGELEGSWQAGGQQEGL
jgi:hypothetical protein